MPASQVLSRFRLTRFDWMLISALLVLAALVGLILWAGDQVGVRVIAVSPADGAVDVSTQANIRVTFDQPVVVDNLTLWPAVDGDIHWEGNTLVFSPAMPLAAGTTYTVNLPNTLVDETERPLQGTLDWQFQTRRPRVLYVALGANNYDQLYAVGLGGGNPVQLTQAPLGIGDYALSPDAAILAYTVLRENGGMDLWRLEIDGGNAARLLFCPGGACSTPVWAPDGQRLIYERRTLAPVGGLGPPRLWWLNLVNGETAPIFDDDQVVGYSAAWSPDGQWISYVSPVNQGVQLYNVADGRNFLVPSRLGGRAVWSPAENTLLVSDSIPGNEGFFVHLFRVVPEQGELVDVTGEGQPVEDGTPAWSPDGAWVVFTRRPSRASMGKQIWIMRADGSEARYLTASPDIHYGLPVWSPDGRMLAFQQFPLKEIGELPTISLLDVESGEIKTLVYPGRQPVWLP